MPQEQQLLCAPKLGLLVLGLSLACGQVRVAEASPRPVLILLQTLPGRESSGDRLTEHSQTPDKISGPSLSGMLLQTLRQLSFHHANRNEIELELRFLRQVMQRQNDTTIGAKPERRSAENGTRGQSPDEVPLSQGESQGVEDLNQPRISNRKASLALIVSSVAVSVAFLVLLISVGIHCVRNAGQQEDRKVANPVPNEGGISSEHLNTGNACEIDSKDLPYGGTGVVMFNNIAARSSMQSSTKSGIGSLYGRDAASAEAYKDLALRRHLTRSYI